MPRACWFCPNIWAGSPAEPRSIAGRLIGLPVPAENGGTGGITLLQPVASVGLIVVGLMQAHAPATVRWANGKSCSSDGEVSK